MSQSRISGTLTDAAQVLSQLAPAPQNNHGVQLQRRAEAATPLPRGHSLVAHAIRTLSDNIHAAEEYCGGRAVQAEYCNRPNAPRGATCMVTLLVDEERLVEVALNSSTGEVLSRRNLSAFSCLGVRIEDFVIAQSLPRSVTDVTDWNAAGQSPGSALCKISESNSLAGIRSDAAASHCGSGEGKANEDSL